MTSRMMLFVVAYLAIVAAGISGTLFSAYLPVIVRDLTGAVDRESIARVGSSAGAAFLFGWAIGAILLGAIGDRIGRKMAFFTSVMVCTVGIVTTAWAPSVSMLVVIRFITGAGAGSSLLLGAVMVSEAWENNGRAWVMGILANAFPVGLIVSGAIGNFIDDWRTAYQIGGSTMLLGLAVLFVVKESDLWRRSEETHRATAASRERVFDPMFRRDLLIGTALFGSMLIGLWAVFVWMPTWVGSLGTAETSQAHRAATTLALGFGSVTGGFLSGPFSVRFGRRGAAAIGYLGCLALTAIIFTTHHEPGVVIYALAFVLSAFIGINQGVLVGYVPELFPTLIRGAATGIAFNVGRLVTALAVISAGLLITWLGGYDKAIFTFGASYVIGLAMLLVARETQGQDLPV